MKELVNQELFAEEKDSSNRIIYTPSHFAKSNLLYLQEVGRLSAKEVHTSSRKNLDSFLFFSVEKGSGRVIYDGQSYELKKGDCIFFDCHKSYLHRSSEDLWSLKWIHFNGNNMSSIYNKYIERGGKPVFSLASSNYTERMQQKSSRNIQTASPVKEDRMERNSDNSEQNSYENQGEDSISRARHSFDSYSGIWRDIFILANSQDHIRDMKLNERLASLLSCLMEESVYTSEKKENSKKKGSMINIKNYLELNYQKHISLDELASSFFINKYYMVRSFKEEYGVTINDYLLRIRINRAKSLLRFSDSSVEKIGYDCGLSDACYFSRKFKSVEGLSPREYRYKWR